MTAGSTDNPRDRRVVQRALVAGAIVWGLCALTFIALAVGAGEGPRTWAAVVLIALLAGVMVTTGWLLLAAVLDLIAGVRPSGRRLAWTAGMFAFTVLLPVVVLAALTVR